jgi:hypothetical protein
MNIFKPESFEDVSINLEAESTTEEKKGDHWQSGKVALQLAHDMVKNPIVKLIIRCCIYLGDGIEERICKAE